MSRNDGLGARLARLWHLRRKLGPGLITGAADDDPSGIATYSQAGAQWGYGLLWSVVITTPLMIAVQLISARIGVVTGRGLAANFRRTESRPVVAVLVGLLVFANTLNIAADLAAMGQSVKLLIGGYAHLYALGLALLSLGLQLTFPYQRYVRILKWFTLTLFAYAGTLFMTHVDWGRVFSGSLWPRFIAGDGYVSMLVAVLGTTISPYLFFWQASQEVEERELRELAGATSDVRVARRELKRVRWDTAIGMVFSNLIAFCIILTAGVALHENGITVIETTAQAAEALRPIVGELAYLLFAAGVIGTGLLAIPVLAGSAAYAGAEALDAPVGLRQRATAARTFYAILTAATLAGVALTFAPIDPIKMLYYAALVNGVIAVPFMIGMLRLVSRRDVMGQFVASRRLKFMAWLTVVVVGAAVIVMLIDML